MIDLKGRKALVTGGSRGIGKAITSKLCEAGATVVFTYLSNEEAAKETLLDLKSKGYQAYMFQANMGDEASIVQLFEFIALELGGLDILINNAGITKDGLMLRMKLEDFDQVMETNLRGVFMTTQKALKMILKSEHGKIVNITSVSGILGNAGQTNYSASKAGLIGLTKALAREVASRHINVNAVAPGFIVTDMTNKLNESQIEQIQKQIPFNRFGEVTDIANAVLFLSSSLSNYMTGQVIVVDGGMVMPV
jgi:3-oxoacyl-[acyl-carrier protein] reductase